MRRRRHHTYEYGYRDDRPYEEKVHRNPKLVWLDRLLFVLVIPVPLIGLLLQIAKIAFVPVVVLTAYTAVVQTVAGLLFLILTAANVGGFGKVGYFFTHTHGKRWMTTKEAKQNTYLFGVIMLVIGVLMILWTFKK